MFVALALCLTLIADSAQSQRRSRQQPVGAQSAQPAQPAAPDQRGTDQVPLTVKVLPSADAKEKTEQEEHDRTEKAIIDKKLAFETQRIADYTDRLALFTVFLFSIAVLQAGLFIWQLLLIRKSLDEAKIAGKAATDGALAAKLNAQAVIDADRGWPFVSIEAHNLQEMVASAAQLPQHDDYTTSALRIKYAFKNHGRTPVIIKEVGHHLLMQIAPLSQILEERGYERLISLPIEHIISPGDKSGPIVCQLDQRFTVADAKSVARADNTLWFFGYISYDDTFGFGRELHFIWHYNGASGGLRLYSYREIQSHTKH